MTTSRLPANDAMASRYFRFCDTSCVRGTADRYHKGILALAFEQSSPFTTFNSQGNKGLVHIQATDFDIVQCLNHLKELSLWVGYMYWMNTARSWYHCVSGIIMALVDEMATMSSEVKNVKNTCIAPSKGLRKQDIKIKQLCLFLTCTAFSHSHSHAATGVLFQV